MNLSCPKCNICLGTHLETEDAFRLFSATKGEKRTITITKKMLGALYCRLPVTFTCANRQIVHTINSVSDWYTCTCAGEKQQAIVVPYSARRRQGEWVKLDLTKTMRSLRCSDARMTCINPKCAEEMFMADFFKTGRTLGNKYQRAAEWTDFSDGKPTIRATDDPSQNYVDYEI